MNELHLNFNPKIWGNNLWQTLHVFALSYPLKPSGQDRQNIKDFFLSLKTTLPCDKCRKNFADHTKTLHIDDYLDSPFKLFDWTVKLRNKVAEATNSSYRINGNKLKNYYFARNLDSLYIPDFTKVLLYFIMLTIIIFIQIYFNFNYKLSLLFDSIYIIIGLFLFKQHIYYYTYIPNRWFILFFIIVLSVGFYKKYYK